MGLDLFAVDLFVRQFPHGNDRRRLVTLGRQDCYFTAVEAQRLLSRHGIAAMPVSEDPTPADTFAWMSPAHRAETKRFIAAERLFELMGFHRGNIDSLDYSDFEGASIIADLNLPVDRTHWGAFDIVFDSGTIEHVFSTRDSFQNILRMCRVGGFIVHLTPTDMINHGLYNFNPGLFDDVYTVNGCERIDSALIAAALHNDRKRSAYYLRFEPRDVKTAMQPYYNLMTWCVFRKVTEGEFVMPYQGAYRSLWQKDHRDALRDARRPWIERIDRRPLLSTMLRLAHTYRRGQRVRLR
jgi:SAM-dependent methyltransferase